MWKNSRSPFPLIDKPLPNPKPISEKKNKKPESHAIKPDSVIVSSLIKHIRSQSSSSSSETHLNFDAASVSELERIVLRDKDQKYDDAVLDDEVIESNMGGAVNGRLIITKNGHSIDCSKLDDSGILIPSNVSSLGNLKSDALFILLVEHSDVFYRIVTDQFYNRIPCIIIMAEGTAHGATRNFLKRLKEELKLPVLALVNSDPYGLQILSFYTCGSVDIKWLGLRPSDLDKHQISHNCRLPMTDDDVKVAKDLLKKDFVKRNEGWVKELEIMVKTRQKAEVMALSSWGIKYLTKVYLPLKLQQQDWL